MPELTCPNASLDLDGHCDGRLWIMHRGQPIPCPSCWAAANKPPIGPRQRTAMRRWHILLTIVAGQRLLVDPADSAAFDRACADLDRLGVDDTIRSEWTAWLAREGAPLIEVST